MTSSTPLLKTSIDKLAILPEVDLKPKGQTMEMTMDHPLVKIKIPLRQGAYYLHTLYVLQQNPTFLINFNFRHVIAILLHVRTNSC